MPTPFRLSSSGGFTSADIGVSALAAPGSLSLVAATTTTLAISWAAVTNATGYLAQVSDPSGHIVQTISTASLGATFDNLVTGTLYTVTVQATAIGSSVSTNSYSTL